MKNFVTGPFVALLIVAAIFVGSLAFVGGEGFWVIDNANKFIQVRTLVESGYRNLAVDLPGRDLDPGFEYNPLPPPFGFVRDHKLYSIFPPFFSFASSFPFRLLGTWGLFLLPLLGGLLTVAAAIRILQMLGAPSRGLALAAVLLGLATPVWFYSIVFWEQIVAVALVAWGLAFGLRFLHQGERRTLFLSAAFFAFGVYFRDDYFIAAPAWLCVLFVQHGRAGLRPALQWTGGFLICLLPLALFNSLFFGDPLGFHISGHLGLSGGLVPHLSDRAQVAYNLFLDSGGKLIPSLMFGVPLLTLLMLRPTLTPRRHAWGVLVAGLFGVAYAAYLLADLTQAEGRLGWLRTATSLFPLAPVVLFGLVARRPDNDACPTHRLARALSLFVAAYCALYLLFSPVVGSKGFSWANRHLLLVYPPLVVATVYNLLRFAPRPGWPTHVGRALVVAVCLVSIGWQVFSVSTLSLMKRFSRELNTAVLAQNAPVVLTDVFWVPQTAYEVFGETPIFFIRHRSLFDPLAGRLATAGYRNALFVTQTAGGTSAVPDAEVRIDGLDYFQLKLYRVDLSP